MMKKENSTKTTAAKQKQTDTVWSFVNAISKSKKDILKEGVDLKLYDPWIINKAFSFYPDTILYANEMNLYPNLDKDCQFSYYINTTIRPMTRKGSWMKKTKDGDIEAVKQYYGYNTAKAEVALSLLSPEQLETIYKRLDKGGK